MVPYLIKVNGAARIEALGAGGQVLISIETHARLTFEEQSAYCFTFLGRFPLKGMVNEQEVVQVSSSILSKRRFPEINRATVAAQAAGVIKEKPKFGFGPFPAETYMQSVYIQLPLTSGCNAYSSIPMDSSPIVYHNVKAWV